MHASSSGSFVTAPTIAIRRSVACLGLIVASTASTASADITDWAAAVAAGTPARYSDAAPVTHSNVDIGTYAGTSGATYEVIFNAGNYNAGAGPAPSGSSALIGVRNTFVGDQSGAKFEQWFDSGQYGVTQFGIADHFCGANVEGVDLHLVFVCDTQAGITTVYENGVAVGSAPHAFRLAGMVGIGQVHDPTGGDADLLGGLVFGVAVYDSMLPLSEIVAHRDAYFSGGVGTSYCTAVPNSTGATGVIEGNGSAIVANDDLVLVASALPQNAFGYFLTSPSQGFIPNPGGSRGNLCLAGSIGRFAQQIQNSGATGSFSIAVDLQAFPTPGGLVAVLAGQTHHFQAWHRDIHLGTPTSNFTNGLTVMFV